MDSAVHPSARSTKKTPKGRGGTSAVLEPIQTRESASVADAQARQILAALKAFASGDFQARLPATWSGTEGGIAEAVNQCIANAHRIAEEAARLSNTVGKEGRLSQRLTTPGVAGGWAAQVDSF